MGMMRGLQVAWMIGAMVAMLFCAAPSVQAQFLDVEQLFEERNLAPLSGAFEAGEYSLCERACQAAIERGLKSILWHKVRVQCLIALGRESEAAEVAVAAVDRFPEDLGLLMLRHRVASILGDDAAKKDVLDRVNGAAKKLAAKDRTAEDWVALGEAALALGADAKKVIEQYWVVAQRKDPAWAPAYLAEGELALAKDDAKRAADVFRAGLKACGEKADLRAGLARSFFESDRGAAAEQAQRALEINERHEGAWLLQAELALTREDYDGAHRILEAVLEQRATCPEAWALQSAIRQIAFADAKGAAELRQRGLVLWNQNPKVDHLIGHCLSRAYRFSEGAGSQRQALKMDPDYLPARLALCHDLLRLGEETEAWKLAEAIRADDGYQVQAHNLGLLEQEMSGYHTESARDFTLRMPKREWPIYGERALELLREALAVLAPKYGFKPRRPILVEFFPSQQDFAIRTFGKLGGQGMLGACFGTVVTMNSPGSLAHGRSNWEATLWHEFCHVVTLSATLNRMPRWLSEGISVYEEALRDPAWGMSLTTEFREMILADEGPTPLSELSSAFLGADSSEALMFAYYESGQAVAFLIDEFGPDTLKAILADLAKGVRINDAITAHTTSMKKVEDRFEKHLLTQVRVFEGKADWSKPAAEDMNPADPDSLAQYLKKHPNNLEALKRQVGQWVEQEEWGPILEVGQQLEALMPANNGSEGGLSLQALALKELGRPEEEAGVLRRLVAAVPDDTTSMIRLMELERAAGNWQGLRVVGEKLLALNPFLPRAWHSVADAAEALGDSASAIRACERLLLLDDQQAVQAHFRLAKLLRPTDVVSAKRHLLDALAMAPRFREGLAMLSEMAQPGPKPSDGEPVAE